MTNYIPRSMQPTLKEVLATFPIATICGPRQSGKTTLCRKEFPSLPYVNLEDLTTRQFATDDPKGFVNQFEHGAIIDEAQLVPELFNQLQVKIDEERFSGEIKARFILTGSSNFAFLPSLRQSLAGRTGILTLLPLSTNELENGGFIDLPVDIQIIKGGFPEVWIDGQDKTRLILENYINTYVERDVRKLLEVGDYQKFSAFIRICASRIGSELNKSSIAVEIGVSVSTVERWLSVLEASYVIYLLKPWYANIGKRLVKTPKLYFYDTGIACTMLGIHTREQLLGHPLRGGLFENLVINNLVKWGFNRGLQEQIYFFRDKTGREVDIIRETPEGLMAYEVKAGMTYNTAYKKNIDYLKGLLGDRIIGSGIIYTGDVEMKTRENALIKFRDFPDKII